MKKHDVEQIIKAFSKKYGKQAKEIENAIRKAMANGMSITEAVKEATKETEAWMTSHVMESMLLSVSAGSGVHFEELPPALTNAWDASGMKLSKKIHGTTKEMRSAIISTLCKAQKDGKKVIETARALYDGYGYGHVTRTQPLPDYLDKVLTYARRMDLSDKDKDALMREIRNAKRVTECLSQNNAPNRTLKAVYKELVTHIERSEDRMMERSLKAAVEEKSRYIAERIARTESARAWADGFIARYGDDEDVVAYQWKTGSRHPEEDICDMYANANLWNLGKGIFPKDKCPILPIHPHCLCHLAPVFISEVDIDNAQDQRDVATCDWLKRQNENTRENLLGVKGNKAWEEGRKTWRTVLRNYSPKVMKSRIVNGIMNIKIDRFTPCLVDRKTGEIVNTTFEKTHITAQQAKKLRKEGWNFDWSIPEKEGYMVYKLTLMKDSEIQGLISLKSEEGYVFAGNAENAPYNLGHLGRYEGVGGHLFAIACLQSKKRGYGGLVVFDAKTKLIEHYQKVLNAKLINAQRMYIDERAAEQLLKQYNL